MDNNELYQAWNASSYSNWNETKEDCAFCQHRPYASEVCPKRNIDINLRRCINQRDSDIKTSLDLAITQAGGVPHYDANTTLADLLHQLNSNSIEVLYYGN